MSENVNEVLRLLEEGKIDVKDAKTLIKSINVAKSKGNDLNRNVVDKDTVINNVYSNFNKGMCSFRAFLVTVFIGIIKISEIVTDYLIKFFELILKAIILSSEWCIKALSDVNEEGDNLIKNIEPVQINEEEVKEEIKEDEVYKAFNDLDQVEEEQGVEELNKLYS